jgi:hypothetical protein
MLELAWNIPNIALLVFLSYKGYLLPKYNRYYILFHLKKRNNNKPPVDISSTYRRRRLCFIVL